MGKLTHFTQIRPLACDISSIFSFHGVFFWREIRCAIQHGYLPVPFVEGKQCELLGLDLGVENQWKPWIHMNPPWFLHGMWWWMMMGIFPIKNSSSSTSWMTSPRCKHLYGLYDLRRSSPGNLYGIYIYIYPLNSHIFCRFHPYFWVKQNIIQLFP